MSRSAAGKRQTPVRARLPRRSQDSRCIARERRGLSGIGRVLPERGASAGQVIRGNYHLHSPERGVGKVDVDVSLSKLPSQLAERAGPILDIGHQHLALVGDPDPGTLQRLPAPGNGSVIEEQMGDTPALTGERREAADTDADFASDLPQPGELSWPVFENHSQVRGHRIFDHAIWSAPGKLVVAKALQPATRDKDQYACRHARAVRCACLPVPRCCRWMNLAFVLTR